MIMTFEGLSYGWIIVLLGAAFFVLEAFSPGFFLLVPGTVLIIIGVLVLFGIDIFNSFYGILFAIIITLLAALLSVIFYRRLNYGNNKEVTTNMDSIIGKTGIVEKDVNNSSISGKVLIEGNIWSASSVDGIILAGKKIEVTGSEGVHVIVKELE